MPLRSGGPAPYAPGSTVIELLQTYRDRGLTTPFSQEVLARAGVAETLIPRTLLSLRHLDLIGEDGAPTPALESLRVAPAPEYQQRLEEIVRAVYAEVFQFADPAKDDLDRVHDAFRSYTPPGQRRRMVALFLSLCELAGIIPEGKKPASPSTRARPSRTNQPKAPRKDARQAPSGRGSSGRMSYTDVIPAPLTGLLASLPPEGEGWTQGQRDKFVKTFESVLDYAIPIVSSGNGNDDAE